MSPKSFMIKSKLELLFDSPFSSEGTMPYGSDQPLWASICAACLISPYIESVFRMVTSTHTPDRTQRHIEHKKRFYIRSTSCIMHHVSRPVIMLRTPPKHPSLPHLSLCRIHRDSIIAQIFHAFRKSTAVACAPEHCTRRIRRVQS